MPPSPTTASGAAGHRATLWDRLAVLMLGAAGCVLSYDALRQMAFAIHVRSALTYLFPVVIDGFIAYGVRALLVLRDAPLRARLYVWALFASATVASIWANALHAIRLNQLPTAGTELRLGDTTVGVLSTLAPLALAGATHLHILITRHGGTHPPTTGHRAASAPKPVPEAETVPAPTPAPAAETLAAVPATGVEVDQELLPTSGQLTDGAQPPLPEAEPVPVPTPATAPEAPSSLPVAGLEADQEPIPDPDPAGMSVLEQLAAWEVVDAGQGYARTSGRPAHPGRTGRPPAATIEELVHVVRDAHPDLEDLSRTSGRAAINAQGLTVSADRLTEVLDRLRPDAEARPRTGLAADHS
ncbi:DUF2637 domain-containing protein [Streptacidiphilus sp. P02-A3a]|uniref:DUF2637 domain-containing protein n=1 Tax=Streptacidiphilus sp. P02-A3a TaxID=2704468 RepID=UPI0015FADE18|nr:DUF2637 domain-containing protein [Streptacidiphilus sp. P02-A3a]QMU67181.1 DUF2637 domain-containing protein [Streptacidiphilus sp. P02-A3a]